MPKTAPEAARIAGLPWDEKRYRTDAAYNEALGEAYYLSRVKARGGDYSKAALDYHSGMGNVDKGKIGPAGRDYLRKFGADFIPERNTETAQGRASSFLDQMGLTEELWGGLPSMGTDKVKAYYDRILDPKAQEKSRKEDMWMTLAQIGAGMAATDSPSFLQAAGAAIANALPAAAEAKKERQQVLKDARTGLREILGTKRSEEKQVIDTALTMQGNQQRLEGDEADRKFRAAQAREERSARITEAALNRQADNDEFDRRLALQQAAEKKKGLEGLVASYTGKLTREAEAGTWKTPQGNKPSVAIINHWAYQHAMEDWQKYMKSSGAVGNPFGGMLPPAGEGAETGDFDFTAMK
jgi:hypothetical protein